MAGSGSEGRRSLAGASEFAEVEFVAGDAEVFNDVGDNSAGTSPGCNEPGLACLGYLRGLNNECELQRHSQERRGGAPA